MASVGNQPRELGENVSDEIRLLTDDEIPEYVAISADAYPGFPTVSTAERVQAEERLAVQVAEGRFRLIGLFRDGVLAGGMRLFRFTMTVRDVSLVVGGVGSVAVHALYRKQGVARALIRSYHNTCRDEGMALSALYPFRPDFYGRMGYGVALQNNWELIIGDIIHGFYAVLATILLKSGQNTMKFVHYVDNLDQFHSQIQLPVIL